MISPSNGHAPAEPREVLIVGGGIAGIEALMALADLGDNRLRLRLVADHASFVLPPQLLGVPWGGPSLHIDHERLCRAFGARFTLGTVTGVDTGAREVYTAGGETLEYEHSCWPPARGARSPTGRPARSASASCPTRSPPTSRAASPSSFPPGSAGRCLPISSRCCRPAERVTSAC